MEQAKRATALALALCLLQGAMAPEAWSLLALRAAPALGLAAAPDFPPVAPPAQASRREQVEGLAEMIETALEAGSSGDKSVAVDALGVEALDLRASRGRSSAATILLRSIDQPGLIKELRRFVRNHAESPDQAARVCALLDAWHKFISDSEAADALAAALSDLRGSLGGMADEAPADPPLVAAGSTGPGLPLPPAVRTSAPAPLSASVRDEAPKVSALSRGVINGLAPPGRAPPSIEPFPFPSLLPPSPRPKPDPRSAEKDRRTPRPFLVFVPTTALTHGYRARNSREAFPGVPSRTRKGPGETP